MNRGSAARVDNCAGRKEGRTERSMAERSMVDLGDCVAGMGFRERFRTAGFGSLLGKSQDPIVIIGWAVGATPLQGCDPLVPPSSRAIIMTSKATSCSLVTRKGYLYYWIPRPSISHRSKNIHFRPSKNGGGGSQDQEGESCRGSGSQTLTHGQRSVKVVAERIFRLRVLLSDSFPRWRR